MAIKANSSHQIICTVPKASDLETHLRVVSIEGVEYLELRDFITSSGEYGRGYWIPLDAAALQELASALVAVSKQIAGSSKASS